MADADEDLIPQTSTTEADDLEDETQDFRFLSQLTSLTRTGQTIIPKRGTKDFEPNPTRSQASALDASRLAMHTALSAVRVHAGKSHVVGQYLPEESDWRWDEDERGVRHGRCVVVYKFKSVHSRSMGVADRNNWTWFLPEEALWLLERGGLDIRWPDVEEEQKDIAVAEGANPESAETNTSEQDAAAMEDPSDGEENPSEPVAGDLPMSVQGAYASFIGKDNLTLERYTVYAGLKRAGYIVQRAPTWHNTDLPQANGHQFPADHLDSRSLLPTTSLPSTNFPLRTPISNVAAFIHKLVSYLFRPQRDDSCPALGPLVAPGLYRNYLDIFRALALIPYHDNSPSSSPSLPPQPPYQIHLHVWKPSTSSTYKKTSPPLPDYKICVIDARTTSSIPTLAQIGPLLDSQDDDLLSKDQAGRLETRIRHGRRNVLLGIVDMGVVSYLRLSDACFGAEKLFEEKVKMGSKGGGGRRRFQGKGLGQGHQQRRPGQTR